MGKISCFYCNRKCKGDVLKVGEKYFHKECFTCKVCHKRMENTGFFYKDDSFYCLDDYTRYCAAVCFSCNKKIIGEVVTALDHTFHKQCFKCAICQKCFSPGDKVSMRMTDFLCNHCCGQSTILNKESGTIKYDYDHSIYDDQNHLDVSDGQVKDSQSSTVPIRRKHVSNELSNRDRSLSNSLIPPKNSPVNGRFSGDNDLDSSARSSLVMAPKHFHLPPGNSRSWLYSSSVVGSKSHPLALSANNINRPLSNSTHRLDNGDSVASNSAVKKMSSYPSGDVHDGDYEAPIDRDEWPAPPSNAVILLEKNRRKMQNPTVEALSGGSAPRIRKPRSTSQYTENGETSNNSLPLNRLRLSEVLNRSSTEFSSLPQMDDQRNYLNDLPLDPVSASRTPSAVCEPLAPPRYDNHTETSPSRNDDYFRGSNRHLGYSMEFISSTNRPYLSESTVAGVVTNLRNSNVELRNNYSSNNNTNDNCINENGLKKIRAHSNVIGYRGKTNGNNYAEQFLKRESEPLSRTQTIPYGQLRASTLKMVRHINKANLEAYLSEEEFFQLFQLTRPAFYQLPEWKRNDLKKRVDLF